VRKLLDISHIDKTGIGVGKTTVIVEAAKRLVASGHSRAQFGCVSLTSALRHSDSSAETVAAAFGLYGKVGSTVRMLFRNIY
jgi:hypothetical protein